MPTPDEALASHENAARTGHDQPHRITIPDEIEVLRDVDGRLSVYIDGEEFPYAIAPESVAVDIEPHGPPTVRLTLLAARVSVTNDLPH